MSKKNSDTDIVLKNKENNKNDLFNNKNVTQSLFTLDDNINQEIDRAVELHKAGNLKEAEAVYKEILEHFPNNPEALHLQGLVHHARNENEIAKKYILKSLSIKSTNTVRTNLTTILIALKEYDVALKMLQDIYDQEPLNQIALFNLANAMRLSGQKHACIEYYDKLLAINHKHVNAIINKSCVLLELNEYERAMKFLNLYIRNGVQLPELYNNLAVCNQRKHRIDQAIKLFAKAIELNPNYLDALSNLGQLYIDRDCPVEALPILERLHLLLPKKNEVTVSLANIYRKLAYFQKALDMYKKSKLDDLILYNIGYCMYYLEMFDQAKEECFKLLKWPNVNDFFYHQAFFNVANVYLVHEDFRRSKAYWWARWRACNLVPRPYKFPVWHGQSLKDKTILICGEQGVGDEVMFASLLPYAVKDAKHVILESHHRLVPLFARSFPNIEVLVSLTKPVQTMERKDIDYRVPIGDIMFYVDIPEHRVPFMIPDMDKVNIIKKKYDEIANGKLKIGISWYTTDEETGWHRTVGLKYWKKLLKRDDCIFFNLQYGKSFEEITEINEQNGFNIIHDRSINPMKNLDNFASQLCGLDLIITIANSTAHFAGALGIPALVLTPKVPSWRWMLNRDDTLWYGKHVKLYRQKVWLEWEETMDRIINDLENNFIAKHNKNLK